MTIYQEKPPARTWWIGHVLLCALLYLPNLGVHELRPEEALYAGMAWEMSRTGRFFETRLHGEAVRAFPLQAWLIAAVSGFRKPTEWTARLPSVLAILGIAGISGYVAARAAGHLAGAAAAAMVLTAPVAMAEAERAGGGAVFAFLITLAWFSWYRLGRIEKRWNTAWLVALGIVCLAAFHEGLLAFLYFYFPLLFLRRPFRFLVRARAPGHLIGLGACVAALVGWHALFPEQVFFPWKAVSARMVPESSMGYLGDLAWFPIHTAVYLFPWTFLAWPGFCAAFRPLERTPVFCRYLRTLIVPVFAAGWLLPDVSPRALLPALGPLAALTGIHYALLVRRYHRQLSRIPVFLARAAVAAGCGVLAAAGLHVSRIVVLGGLHPMHVGVAAFLAAGAVLIGKFYVPRLQGAWLWRRLAMAVLAVRLAYLAVGPPLHAAWHGRSRAFASRLAAGLPEDVTVYRIKSYLMAAECFYLGHPVIRIWTIRDVPREVRNAPVLYVLGGDDYPVLDIENRHWIRCSRKVNLDARYVLLVQQNPFRDIGKRGWIRIQPRLLDPPDGRSSDVVCMYKGVLRSLERSGEGGRE